MGIHLRYLKETFAVYRYKSTIAPNDIGEMPAPNPTDATNLEKVGEVKANVNMGDSLEPDIRGVDKDYGIDNTTFWLLWCEVPVGFDMYAGDIIVNTLDSSRQFQIQFIDKYPGGVSGHHYEGRLLTSEIFRGES